MDKEQTPFKYQQQVAILLSLSQTIARLTRLVGGTFVERTGFFGHSDKVSYYFNPYSSTLLSETLSPMFRKLVTN